MLTLVIGADRNKLSSHAMEWIKNSAERGENDWILIVPEQFSFEAERNMCRICEQIVGRSAEVLSFSRLSDRVASIEGGIAGAYLDKGGQMLTMALAAEQVASRIKLYAAVLKKPEFLADMIRMISELRSYCVDPMDLMQVAKKAEGQLAQKLEELGILYEAYLAVCANGNADPSDKLVRLYNALEDCSWVRSKYFYLDGFSDFTGAEEKVIEELLSGAKEVYINLPSGKAGSVMHYAAEKTAGNLRRLAQRQMVRCEVVRIEPDDETCGDIQTFLSHMFSYGEVTAKQTDTVKLTICASVEEECRAVAIETKRLIKAGARYKEICVASTNPEQYEIPLRNTFRAAGISAYFAGERGLLSKPIVIAVVNSIYAAVGAMDYEDVALYLKSGLPLADRECCDRLDQYAYLWNVRGSLWSAKWQLHPRGLGEEFLDEDLLYLTQLNDEKELVLTPLLMFRQAMMKASNTADMVLALHRFLEDIKLRERLEEKANACVAEGAGQTAQELAQIYEVLVNSMEQMWMTLGQTQRSPEDFCRLYHAVLSQYEVATIPAGLDQVHISDLPDLRNRKIKHLLVLGASDGSFPSYKTDDGLLSEKERMYLMEQGISVAPGNADQMDQELSKIYFALCAAQESIWMSYCGEQPAWLFRRAMALYPQSVISQQERCVLNVSEMAAWNLRNQCGEDGSNEELKKLQKDLKILCNYEFSSLKEETVKRLYGSPIALSPSKIDKFAACRFAFFMNYGLKAKPRKQAKLDQPAFGTFVHAVLEHTVLRVKDVGGFPKVGKEQLLSIASEEINRYAQAHFPEQAKREEYLFKRSETEIRDIVLDLWEELRRSKFQPEFCELKFTGGQELPAVQISGSNAECCVIGMVDRVDLYHEEGKTYARVVDYKTGVKDFDYTDILNGAGLQMLIYLFALKSLGEEQTGIQNLEPAGVLYLPAKKEYPLTEPMPDDEVVEKEHRDRRKRKGLIRADENLLAAMEEDPQAPQFMPYKCGRRGITGDLATEEQMRLIERHVMRSVAEMADQIAEGDIVPNPIVRGQYSSCNYCDYKTVCHKDMDTQKRRILAETSAAKFWEELERREKEHG